MMLRTMESCVRSFILASNVLDAPTAAPTSLSQGETAGKRRPRIPRRRRDARRSAAPKRVRYARPVNASTGSRPAPRPKRWRLLTAAFATAAGLCLVGLALAGPRPFRALPGVEHDGNEELPADYMVPGEWAFARLMYPTCHSYSMRGCVRGEGDYWKQG